ncbi:MAG: MBOAT family protein [Leptospiraceae bacterium]|nr:MBOAT family protein [Leptospiraceae bacterium]
MLIIAPLVMLKYGQFMGVLDEEWQWLLPASLPLGISFYTFQGWAYVTARLRGQLLQTPGFGRVALYLLFFPQLVAGPIVRPSQLIPQFDHFDRNRLAMLKNGLFLIVSGYIKKALLADNLAAWVDPVYANPTGVGAGSVLLAVVAYGFQIYLDFSGYSDIAIGIARLFGIRLPENFRFPYSACDFQSFWRRWHITLSTWLRDHLYIPMGGSRRGKLRLVLALGITMLLGGLWHGAHWNYVLWGGAHGLLLAVERWIRPGNRSQLFRRLYRFWTLGMVFLLWVPFRAGAYPDGWERMGSLLGRLMDVGAMWGSLPEKGVQWVLIVMLGYGVLSARGKSMWRWLVRWPAWATGLLAVTVVLAVLLLAPGESSFIYFVF